jgi:hypothetical protein
MAMMLDASPIAMVDAHGHNTGHKFWSDGKQPWAMVLNANSAAMGDGHGHNAGRKL